MAFILHVRSEDGCLPAGCRAGIKDRHPVSRLEQNGRPLRTRVLHGDVSRREPWKPVHWERLQAISQLGTGAVEIKSGYGLSVEGELKMLRVIKKLKEKSNLSIKATFLGAHSYPLTYKENHQGYIDLIINEMLPIIAQEKLADYIDVFCEEGFFSPTETETICKAGMQYGLKPKLHVNQLNSIGGIQAGIKLNAISLDHLETLTAKDIERLAKLPPLGGGGAL